MAYATKSYKKGDGWGQKKDRKYQADRSERHRIKKKLNESKNLFSNNMQNMHAS